MPTDAAIVSAVLKPIPRCRPPAGMAPLDRLDRLVAVLLVDLHRQGRGDAHALQEDHHLLIARCSAHAAGIRAHRFGPRPGTSIGRAGSSSMTCMISTPKWSTIRVAITEPMPLICPRSPARARAPIRGDPGESCTRSPGYRT